MTLHLIIQCIGFWDFTPVLEPAELFIDGVKYPYTAKTGGYLAVTKPIPDTFDLCVRSRSFRETVKTVLKIPEDKIISLQMIPRNIPHGASQLRILGFTTEISVVLGYGYYRVTGCSDEILTVKNPAQTNLEGRSFLLRDMKNGTEEFITLGAASDIRLQNYKTQAKITGSDFILLPAITLTPQEDITIPLNIPEGTVKPVWIYAQDCMRYEIESGQTITAIPNSG